MAQYLTLVVALLFFFTVTFTNAACPSCSEGFDGSCYTCADCQISIINGQCTCGDGSACQTVSKLCCSGSQKQLPVSRTPALSPRRLGCFLCSGTCCPDGKCYEKNSLCCTEGGACPSTTPICCPPPQGSSTGGCCPAGTVCGPNYTCDSVETSGRADAKLHDGK
jgi:hypothetical protein